MPFFQRPGRDKSPVERLREQEALRAAQWAEEAELEARLRSVEIPPRLLTDAEAWSESDAWFSGFSSSNVRAIRYELGEQRLHVEYGKAGEPPSHYYYEGVAQPTAIALYEAPSKGTFIWDRVRVRGTVTGHQYDYAFVSGPGPRARKARGQKGKQGLPGPRRGK